MIMEWISIKDQPPEKEGSYLVYLTVRGRGRWKVARFNTSSPQKKPHFYANQTFSAKDITHWMPLPEPPQDPLDQFGMGRREYASKDEMLDQFPEKQS